MADLLRDSLKPTEPTEGTGPEGPEGPGKQETPIPRGLCGLDIGTGAACADSKLVQIGSERTLTGPYESTITH